MPNHNLVTLLQVDGIYTRENFQKAFELAIAKGKEVYAMQREALTKKFFTGEVSSSEEMEESA
jgi:ribonuclease PH